MTMTTISIEDEVKLGLKLALIIKLFRVLGDVSRLKILDALLEDENNVGELVKVIGLNQGLVSNHLACLKQCGFVNARRGSKFVYHANTDEQVRQLLQIFQDMITRNAEPVWNCMRVNIFSEED